MCTINSLVRPRSTFSFLSFATILVVIFLPAKRVYASQNGCSAHDKLSTMAITVTAPPDLTIQIRRDSICDTLVILPGANFNTNCLPLASARTITPIGTLNSNGGSLTFPAGIHKIIYELTDNCGITARDTMKLTIYDADPPEIVCRPEMVIYMDNSGIGFVPARSLDGGSFDFCGHVFFKIKRMDRPIGYSCTTPNNPNYLFDDQLQMCCMDFNNPVMVILRVYDVYPGDGPVGDSLHIGHFRDCMVRVSVGDKLPPTLVCPLNHTVNCGVDVDSLFKTQNPFIQDNCDMVVLDSMIINNLNGCGAGTIERRYTATDMQGLSTSCSQIITVLTNSHFNGTDVNQLRWPTDTIIYACRIIIDSINVGEPYIFENECDQIQVRKSDDLFTFSQGGACGKILRKWEVLNWCIYNPALRPNPNIPSNGYYSHIQVIKILDTIPPVIFGMADTTLYSYSSDCSGSFFQLPNFNSEDCGLNSAIRLSFSWDFKSDGIIDTSVIGNNPSMYLSIGRHILYLQAIDSCHNLTINEIHILVKDGKSPTPNLLFGISSTIIQMQAGPMIMVNANLFNNKSEDNCTSNDKLRFSYSENVNDTIRTFTCADRGLNLFPIYVWDECNNFAWAQTYLTITDLDSLCPGNIVGKHTISGLVSSHYGYKASEVKVEVNLGGFALTSMTNDLGRYSFSQIDIDSKGELNMSSEEHVLEGISTSDIIKIQKHILGIENIKSPYDLIAGDVDRNGYISASDIILLRKLILGNIQQYPHKQSIVGIDKNYKFINYSQPWNEFRNNNIYKFSELKRDESLDWVAIKLGDVNGTFGQNNLYQNQEKFGISYYQHEDKYYIIATDNGFVNGFQIGMLFNKDCPFTIDWSNSVLKDFIQDDFVYQTKNELYLSCNFENMIPIHKGDLLFSLNINGLKLFCEDLPSLSTIFSSEVYFEDGSEASIVLTASDSDLSQNFKNFTILQWGPNPVDEVLSLLMLFNKPTDISLSIFDQFGKKVYSSEKSYSGHIQNLKIPIANIQFAGIYYLKVQSGHQVETIKLVKQ